MKTLIFLLVAFCASVVQADEIIDRLQALSVTIKSGTSSGSGVLFTRKDGDESRTFVFTAGHVVDDLRKTRQVFVKGDTKTAVEFGDASVVSEFRENGRRIGETKFDARILKYSDSENGEDLALLEIRKRNYVPEDVSVEFYDGDIPKLGTELYHVGSMLGEPNSLTAGILSQIGRVLDLGANGKIFDQCQCTSMPGSSGGGIFLKSDGKCVGLLVRGAGEGFGLFVPVRRIREWAKESKIEWAMDRKLPMPSEKELRALPLEDLGTGETSDHAHSEEINREFPFLVK